MEESKDISLNKFNGSEVDIADELTRYYLNFVDTNDQANWLKDYPIAGGHERQDISFIWSNVYSVSSLCLFVLGRGFCLYILCGIQSRLRALLQIASLTSLYQLRASRTSYKWSSVYGIRAIVSSAGISLSTRIYTSYTFCNFSMSLMA